jgi:excisionase family DNA binding protein
MKTKKAKANRTRCEPSGVSELTDLFRAIAKELPRSVKVAPLLTLDEVASVLKVSVRTSQRMIALGALVATKIGRSVRVQPQDLAEFMGRRRRVINQEERGEGQ